MLTALSISSMHIRTVIMLRRMITPMSPMVKIVPESIRKALVLGTGRPLDLLLFGNSLLHVVGDDFFRFSLELALADHDGADHGHEKKERGDLEGNEIVPIQGHSHSLGISHNTIAGATSSHRFAVGRLNLGGSDDTRRPERFRTNHCGVIR